MRAENINIFQESYNNWEISKKRLIQHAITYPVIQTQKQLQEFREAIHAFKNMPADQYKRLMEMDFSTAKKEISDRPEYKAIFYTNKALGIINDVLTNRIHNNPLGTKIINGLFNKSVYGDDFYNWSINNARSVVHKTFHDSTRDPQQGVLRLDNYTELGSTAGIDVAWMRAFNIRPADNADHAEVHDLASMFTFTQMKSATDSISYAGLSGERKEVVKPEYYGLGFQWNERKMRFSIYSVNQVLSMMRAAAFLCQTRRAYREIFRMTPQIKDYPPIDLYQTYEQEKDLYHVMASRIRHQLNDVRRKMHDHASGKASLPNQKHATDEAPLRVTADTPFLLYFNHAYRLPFEVANRMIPGKDGVNVPFLDNWITIPTHMAPLSGGWKMYKKNATAERDRNGFFEHVKEWKAATSIAAQAVIPGFRNYFINFRNLVSLQQSEPIIETTNLVMKMEFNAVMDERQKSRIDFGKLPTVSA